MFLTGDYVVYKKMICIIDELRKNYFKGQDYYILKPINDSSLKINVPVNSNLLREPLSLTEVNKIIDNIIAIEPIITNDRFIENEYIELLSTNKHEDLIKIIKTAYLRNKEREDNNKKISSKDNEYFNLAEKYLYSEFSIALGLDFEDTKKYVIDRINSL